MADQFDAICQAIENHTGQRPKGGNTQKKALCPAHSDDKPSLSVRRDVEAGLIGLTCFAGCSFKEIREALGLDARAFRLSPNGSSRPASRTNGHRPAPTTPTPAPSEGRASSKGAPGGTELERYAYHNADGKVLYYNVRFEPKDFRMAGPDGKIKGLPRNLTRVPYNLPAVVDAVQQGRTVYWVEGERDVHSLTEAGEVATTSAGGANAPLDPIWAEYFDGAHVVVVEDNDKPGRAYSRAVARLLVNSARVETKRPAVPQAKADVTDHLRAGYSVSQLLPAPMRSVRRTRWTVSDLLATKPEPLRWVLPGVIPEGLTLLVGAPKVGKSWWNMNLMVALGSGRPDEVFSWGQQVEPSPSLYLALEDPHRRVYSRMNQVVRGIKFPAHAAGDVWLDLPPIEEGGRDEIEKWLDANPEARVVMVDVLAKVRGVPAEGGGMYQADYAAVTALKEIADDYGIGVVVTHHDRKKTDDDFLNMVSGTKGVTGAADTILYLTRDRGSTEGLLRCESRDVEECQYPMEFVRDTGRWHIMGREDLGDNRKEGPAVSLIDQIQQILLARGYARTADLVALLSAGTDEVMAECAKAEQAGVIERNREGNWHVPKR